MADLIIDIVCILVYDSTVFALPIRHIVRGLLIDISHQVVTK
jgi:hypothetical protein